MVGLLGAASVSAGAIVTPGVSATSTVISASNSVRMSKNRHSGRTMHYDCLEQQGGVIKIDPNTMQQMQEARSKEIWTMVKALLVLYGAPVVVLLAVLHKASKDLDS